MDEEKFAAYVQLLHDLGIADAEHYRLSVLITAAEKGRDYPTYIKLVEEYLARPELDADDMTLARWVRPFSDPEVSMADKQKMAAILRNRIAEIESGKRQPQTRMGNMILSKPTDELLRTLVDVLEKGTLPKGNK